MKPQKMLVERRRRFVRWLLLVKSTLLLVDRLDEKKFRVFEFTRLLRGVNSQCPMLVASMQIR